MDYDKALEMFEPVLGFEVHVELNTQTKMFSDAPNPAASGNVAHEPNTMITPHFSAVVHDRQDRTLRIIGENFARFRMGKPMLNTFTAEDIYSEI